MMLRLKSCAAAALTLAALLANGFEARAAEARRLFFDIPAQSLSTALLHFSEQAKVQITAPSQLVGTRQSGGVRGEYGAAEALSQMLVGTGLAFEFINDGAVAIRLVDKTAAATAGEENIQLTRIAQATEEAPQERKRAAQDAGTGNDSEIVVFGKPTRNVDMKRSKDDALPFQVITREQIELQGFQNTSQLAQSFSANTTDTNTEAGSSLATNQAGKVEINLRGLGVSNTLILVNGRRLAANMPYSPQGDVSTIPLSAIDQVEMLSSGASAIYGSSAVGGVVNLILRKEYQGTEFDVSYGNTFDGDASSRKISFVTGFSTPSKKHNITVFGEASDQNPMTAGELGLAKRLRDRILAVRPSLILGSASAPLSNRGNIRSANGTALNIPGNPTAIYAGVPAGYTGTGGIAAFSSTAGTYNLSTDFAGGGGDGLSVVDEMESAGFGLNTYHRFTPAINLFSELSYYYRSQYGVRARSTSYTVPATNAFNPFGQTVQLTTILSDLGEPGFESKFEDMRGVAGIEGALSRNWRYVADYTYQVNRLPTANYNTGFGPLLTGTTVLSSNNPAIAYNPFLDFSSGARNSQAAIDAMRLDGQGDYHHALRQGALRFFGNVDTFGGRRMELAGGAEFRKEFFYDAIASYTNSSGALVYYAENTGRGDEGREVTSAYAEVKLPLLTAGKQKLDLDVAGRMEDFNDFGSTTNPIVALLYQPIEDISFRASWGTGFVAPPLETIGYNNFTPFSGSVTDPKRGGQSVNILNNGALGPAIRPEKSESTSVGFVLQPRAIPNFRMSLDWFSVSKDDNITVQTGQTVVNNEDYLPGLVVRGPDDPNDAFSVGPITQVFYGYINATKAKVEAFDLGLNYAKDTAVGRFSMFAGATYSTKYDIQVAINAVSIDYMERVRDWNGAPTKIRGNLGVSWGRGPFGIGANLRHIGSFNAQTGYVDIQGSTKIKASDEVGMQFTYDFDRGSHSTSEGWWGSVFKGSRLTLNVANLFDQLPPFAAGAPTDRGYSEFSSARGRNYSITFRKGFAP